MNKNYLSFFLILTILSFSLKAQVIEEYYPDGTVKGRGEQANFVYENASIGAIKHPKTKYKKKVGEWTYYYPSGSIMRVETYSDDRKGYALQLIPDGLWQYYNQDEELIKEEVYREGKLQSVKVLMDGAINEDDQLVNIVRKDTGIVYVSVKENPELTLRKRPVFLMGELIRRNVYAGRDMLYQEVIVEQEKDTLNLVQNGGFEEYVAPPDGLGMLGACMEEWQDGGRGRADYLSKVSRTNITLVPSNQQGYQDAYSGAAYAGFLVQQGTMVRNQLSRELEADKTYCLKFFISKSDFFEEYVKRIEVLFSPEPIIIKNPQEHYPQIVFTNEQGYTNSDDWVELCSHYSAKGGERYMTIGSFMEFGKAYYFVDEVSLTEAESAEDCGCILEQTFDMVEYDGIEPGTPYRMAFVEFETMNNKLTESSQVELNKLFFMMDEHKNMKVDITCYQKGVSPTTIIDAQKKAAAINSFLVGMGVSKTRINSTGEVDAEAADDSSEKKGCRVVLVVREK